MKNTEKLPQTAIVDLPQQTENTAEATGAFLLAKHEALESTPDFFQDAFPCRPTNDCYAAIG